MKNTISTYNEKAKLNFKIRDVITPCLNGLELFLKDVKNKIPDSFPIIIDDLKNREKSEQQIKNWCEEIKKQIDVEQR